MPTTTTKPKPKRNRSTSVLIDFGDLRGALGKLQGRMPPERGESSNMSRTVRTLVFAGSQNIAEGKGTTQWQRLSKSAKPCATHPSPSGWSTAGPSTSNIATSSPSPTTPEAGNITLNGEAYTHEIDILLIQSLDFVEPELDAESAIDSNGAQPPETS